jgi:hypothetical protein
MTDKEGAEIIENANDAWPSLPEVRFSSTIS